MSENTVLLVEYFYYSIFTYTILGKYIFPLTKLLHHPKAIITVYLKFNSGNAHRGFV